MTPAPLLRPYPRTSPSETARNVLFFPHSGGSPASYQDLSAALSHSGEVNTAAVHYPGRAERCREPFFTSVHALADQVADALPAWADSRPTLLFGHSLGAVIAYETIRRLPASGNLFLVASGCPAPSWPSPPLLDDRPEGLDERVAQVVRELDGQAAEMLDHPVLSQMFLPVIRADLLAYHRYRPDPGSVIECPVVGLRGHDDARTPTSAMRAWARHTRGGFRLHGFPGGHFFVRDHARPIAEILRAAVHECDVASLRTSSFRTPWMV
ncbi:thioesterase II family protein [Streptomyces sp. NPDC093586]|uniref:thioesterase II family protein n=1 Tax=Streptomyces sp. NPDC093586 TaxID=3366042 RepID=UPI003810D58B